MATLSRSSDGVLAALCHDPTEQRRRAAFRSNLCQHHTEVSVVRGRVARSRTHMHGCEMFFAVACAMSTLAATPHAAQMLCHVRARAVDRMG
jgi:hypothetical protein